MSEIVVGDIVVWEPDLRWGGDENGRMVPLTWAVTVLPTPPAISPIRGGELVIVPRKSLDELQRNDAIGWRDVAHILTGQPISGILVDETFVGAPIPGVPVLLAPEGFFPDAEHRLNRLITEHRAELYRLGSDLSRALSVASIGGADLDALLAVSGEIGKRDLLLLDERGRVVARSRHAPRRLPFTMRPGGLDELLATPEGWVHQQTRLQNGEQVVLAIGPGAAGSPEAGRLVLAQTLTAVEAFLGPGGLRRSPDMPSSREVLLADVLLSNLPPGQVGPRLHALSIDPDEPYSIALYTGKQTGFDGRIRTALRREIRERVCMLSPLELAVVIPQAAWAGWWDELEAAINDQPDVVLTRSDPRNGYALAQHATRQARTLALLSSAGIDVAGSVYELLLPVQDPQAFPPGADRLTAFADRLLAPLEEHDRERGSDLVETLRGYLAAGGSTTAAADLLNIHRNTLGYRLARITTLIGTDLHADETRLAYSLALRIRRLGTLGG